MMKKIFILLTSFIVLFMTACQNQSEKSTSDKDKKTNEVKVNPTGMPIVEKKITLNFFAGRQPASAKDWNDVMIFNEYEKMTNMDIKWEMVPSTGLEEKKNLVLASGDLPDAFHSAMLTNLDLFKYGQQGVFIPLNDLIEKYAPNLKKLMEQYPEIKKALTFPDGKIYSFPTIYEPDFLSLRLGPRPWINQDWLKKLNMEMPETTEELYKYLKAVKQTDLNGNGKADEIPLSALSINSLLYWFKGSFGVGNKGTNHPYVDVDPDNNELRFFPISDEYRAMLEYLNKLYSEGLIDPNIFKGNFDQFVANGSLGLYGAVVSHSPQQQFGGKFAKAYTGATALEGPKGERTYTALLPSVVSIGGFAITKQNPYPEATVRWMDYFYSDEGARLFFMGKEGVTYRVTPEGEYEYLDKITNSPEGLTLDQELAKYLTWPGGGYPGIVTKKYFKGAESSEPGLESAQKLEPYVIDEAWPVFTHTVEETEILTTIGSDIEKFVTEMRDKFITGDVSFSEWDNYVKRVKDMGLDKYMKAYKAGYERYMEN